MSSSALDSLLDRFGQPGWRAPQRYMIILLGLIILWMLVARVDRVVTAPGKVVPFDKVKVIQHLEGGIIADILVRENQEVRIGEPLVKLDLATSGINSAEMNARMFALRLAKVRLDAESSGQSPRWPVDIPSQFKDLVDAEQSTYRNRKMERDNSLQALENQVFQSRKRLAESQERLTALEQSLVLARKELAVSESLLNDKLVSQLDHFQRQSRVTQLNGEVLSLRQAISGAEAAIEEASARRRQEDGRFRRESANEASELERKIASLTEELGLAKDQGDRSVIRSPIEGVIKNLKFQTVGNIVRPGEPMMEVVPLKDQLVIELKLNPSDRGYVVIGQEALVKISTYDYLRYGGLSGKVTAIGADTDLGRNEEQFYKVVVSTNKAFIGDGPNEYPITPGMLGEVDIKVDTRSIFWSLLKPVLKLKAEAFREL
ncbi:MAG: HlyD family type I secretion periplasmic adaptor subunit [Betaproteobacteria bacterium]|nr:HlyD family type I secretion periplasmic adaptor subunit [Betaproteobacteria bacterium]